MQSDPNCPFCKIVKGEIPTKTVYSDDKVMAVLDINPASKGHVLLFPKNHYAIMPVIPPDDFKHLSKVAVKLSETVRSAVLSDKNTIFIANGGAAGQQSAHFMIHIVPSDNLSCFEISHNEDDTQSYAMLKNNIPIMMQNHYKREGKKPSILNTEHLFENEVLKLKIPDERAAKGHILIEAKQRLIGEEIEEFLYAASYSATAVFEGLGAHGTNIMIDESETRLKGHIVPRFSGDGLNFFWSPNKFSEPEMEGLKNAISARAIGLYIDEKRAEPDAKQDAKEPTKPVTIQYKEPTSVADLKSRIFG
jgi:histidine triad (HIT) family protein